MRHKPGSRAYRDQQRERLISLGIGGRQLIEQVVLDLIRCGCRPREAWRRAFELTQDEVAALFNQIRDDPHSRMRGSRICEYEKWPIGGARPSVRALRILAEIYETTWDRLVDIDDLERMPADDIQAFLDISGLRYGDPLDLAIPSQGRRYPGSGYGGNGPQPRRVGPPRPIRGPEVVPQLPLLPSPGPASERPPGSGPPGEVTHFTGRDGPMAELRARIDEQVPPATMVTIYAIDGMAGVGKTAFARHAARELITRYPDGTIWVDLYGHTPGMEPRGPTAALEQMLMQLGVPPEAIKAHPIERQDQWRRHIHGQRMLIVLDNALTSDQVLPLLPEAPGCLVLITSRRKLTGLTDAYPLSLDVLEWDEAQQLLVRLVGEQRCQDPDAVQQILTACGRLPLAIRLIAGRLRHHRGELLADVARDLADHSAALDAFVAEHVSVRTAFEWSYRLLTDAQRRAFRLLGWHPGPEITPVVIVAVAGLSPVQGKLLLRELADHNLLDQLSVMGVPGGPRYRMHDLIRLYAQERAGAEDPLAQRAAALDRLTESYLTITRAADRLLRPYVPGNDGEHAASATALELANASQARAWLSTERHNLLGCVRAISPTTAAADLSALLAIHFRDFGFWADVRYLYSHALAAYRRLGQQQCEVDALWGLGDIEWLVGEYHQAREYYTEALALARELGYRRAEADALWGLGHVERLVGRYRQARQFYTEALALARELGYRRAEADALWGLGHVERLVGEYHQAREYHTRALSLARHLGYQHGEADVLRELGHVERLVDEYHQAREYHTQALTLARHLGYRRVEVDALRGLGEVERLVGEHGQAREYHSQALILAQHLGYRHGEAEALWGLGEVERLTGEYQQAREYHCQALALARHLGYRRVEVDALRGLGEVERLAGEYQQAREYHTQALTLARQLGHRRGEAEALWGLGHVATDISERGQACGLWRESLDIYEQLGAPFAETVRAAMSQLGC